ALRPLPEQSASSWDAMADALRRFLGGASVEWRESHGSLRIAVSRLGLPDLLAWRAQGGPDGRLVIGRRHGNRLLAIDARTTPHVLLSGATGSGKGGAIRAAAAACAPGWLAPGRARPEGGGRVRVARALRRTCCHAAGRTDRDARAPRGRAQSATTLC